MSARKKKRDEAANLLRTVTPEKAFFFYRGIGQPLGVSSKHLSEFATALKGVDAASVRFHLERGDFEGWLLMIGDKSLARQVGALRGKSTPPDVLKAKVSSIVAARVEKLHADSK